MANPNKVRELADRARHLTALKESPSFPALKEIIEGRIRFETKKFIRTPELSGQQIDYYRGLLNGMQIVLDTIEKGPQEFERAMQMLAKEEVS